MLNDGWVLRSLVPGEASVLEGARGGRFGTLARLTMEDHEAGGPPRADLNSAGHGHGEVPHSDEDDCPPPFAEEHRDFYGFLLVASQRIDNVGTTTVWLFGIAVLGLCVSVHMEWIDGVAGISTESVRSYGVYAVFSIAAFFVYALHIERREKALYRLIKPELHQRLRKEGMSVYELLAQIEDDDSLAEISEQLKDDPENHSGS